MTSSSSLLLSSFESSELGAWKSLSGEVVSSIKEFLDGGESGLDLNLDKLDSFLNANCKPHYPNLLCLVLETLPEFDQLFVKGNQIHPKLLSISYKNTLRMLGTSCPPKQLNGSVILQGCAMRLMHRNTNRTREEELKIQVFVGTQLIRLLALNLPNRPEAWPAIAMALLSLKQNCPQLVRSALEALSADGELVDHHPAALAQVYELINKDEALGEEFLTLLVSKLGQSRCAAFADLDVVAKITAKSLGEISLDQVLRQNNMVDFILLGRACEWKQQPESWAKVALQGMRYRAATMATCDYNCIKIDLFCRFAWRIHPTAVLNLIMEMGSIGLHSNSDRARVLLLKLLPEDSALMTPAVKQFVYSQVAVGAGEGEGTEEEVRWKLEALVVRGRFGFYAEEAVELAIARFGALPALCVQVLCANCESLQPNSFRRALELAQSAAGLVFAGKLVSTVAMKTDLLDHGGEEELAMHVLLPSIVVSSSPAAKQECFHHLAEVLAVVPQPHQFIAHVSAQHQHEF
ncbi:hypothetical protein BASA81_006646 [Batrachochytrium salamandrivorans]|nr:hypothetical protein BASA81_006646 [Batrachochytrium salamandrivorans]